MNRRKRIFAGFIFLAGLTCLSMVLLFKKREDWELRYRSATYSEIYFPSEFSRIKAFERSGEQLTVHLAEPDTKCPPISLTRGRQVYDLTCPPRASSFRIDLEYFPKEIYEKAQRVNDGVIEVMASDLPMGNFKQHSFKEWRVFSSEEDTVAAQKILSENGVGSAASTVEKVESVGTFILNLLDKKRGIPSDQLDSLSPLEQYNAIRSGKGQVWCSNMATLYAFFANAAGVQTRLVGVGGKQDDVILSGHAFAESYIPEQKRWAFVDVTTLKLLVTNAQNRVFSTLDLYWAHRLQTTSGLKLRHFDNGKVETVDYDRFGQSEELYFHRDVKFYFPLNAVSPTDRLGKLMKYLWNKDLKYSPM